MFTGMWDPCRLPPFPSHFQAFGTTWTRCTSAGMYIAHILSTKNNNLHINVLLASLLELLIYVRNFFFFFLTGGAGSWSYIAMSHLCD